MGGRNDHGGSNEGGAFEWITRDNVPMMSIDGYVLSNFKSGVTVGSPELEEQLSIAVEALHAVLDRQAAPETIDAACRYVMVHATNLIALLGEQRASG